MKLVRTCATVFHPLPEYRAKVPPGSVRSQCPNFMPGTAKRLRPRVAELLPEGAVLGVLRHHVGAAVRPGDGLPLLRFRLALGQQAAVLFSHVMCQGASVGRPKNGPQLTGGAHEALGGVALVRGPVLAHEEVPSTQYRL